MEIMVVNQQAKIEWTPALEAVVTRALKQVAELHHLGAGVEVSVVLVDDEEIRRLNREYRKKDMPTDVLSFAANETTGEEPEYQVPREAEDVLGDVVVSLEMALRQSEEYGHSLSREVGFLVVHGMLHLLGHDHQDEESRAAMRAAEEVVLAAVGLDR